ncbi:MAG TPA: D-aminoacyl-tRNA deacylase [Spirochaetota bacterium]|nr:D-aminoacyl-tRNA deacylase [Spirochaetota bacterium]HOL57967.1 D-aminoacyl-tRNA deacylase [Spirochaetota bacterium]HPP05477.1 D-aminoacyl-tRNA deacylase [Spirochaetota bacterium]
MRAVVQRVIKSSVKIDSVIYSSINKGLNCLLGIKDGDNEDDIKYMVDKILNLRIFSDENDKMNKSIKDIDGEILIISQFTLYGDARKGRRPSFDKALKGEKAIEIYHKFLEQLKLNYNSEKIKSGVFGAMMEVEIINDGPVTILLDSEKLF